MLLFTWADTRLLTYEALLLGLCLCCGAFASGGAAAASSAARSKPAHSAVLTVWQLRALCRRGCRFRSFSSWLRTVLKFWQEDQAPGMPLRWRRSNGAAVSGGFAAACASAAAAEQCAVGDDTQIFSIPRRLWTLHW